jgi:cellulose synthase (UDP-forming)
VSGNPFSFLWADWRGRLPYRRYREREDRPRRLRALFFSLLTLILGTAYILWVGLVVLRNPGIQDFLFLGAEALAFCLLAFLACDVWHLRYHNPQGLEPTPVYAVDVLVPCCGEPLEVIRTTLRAVVRISYAPVQVYVLDDAASPQVADLARSLGCHYLSRPLAGLPLKDSKSGNLNFALSRSQGELILVLDADQVPAPDILTRLAGYFRFPRLAFVQAKQAFFLPEGDPFYNGDEVFYDAVQLSNDQANAVISCGSGVLYRRGALEEMGGFATWNIVEDVTTSYELLSRGWKGIYYPYALTRGLAPQTLAGVYRQRFQWCLDTMRLFFWDNPLLKSGLNFRQRRHFLLIMLSYLVSGLVFPIFCLIPLLVYWRGDSIFLGQETAYWSLRGAYLAATILMFRYLFVRGSALKQFKMLCGLFPVYGAATLLALFYPPGRKPAYRVNNRQPFAAGRGWWRLTPHLGIILLHLTLPFLSLWLGWVLPRLIVFNAVFSAGIIWVLADLVLTVGAKLQWSPALDPRRVYGG